MQTYKKLLDQLQFEQVSITREYQKLFKEKEVRTATLVVIMHAFCPTHKLHIVWEAEACLLARNACVTQSTSLCLCLACRKRVPVASSPAATCKQGAALTSPA